MLPVGLALERTELGPGLSDAGQNAIPAAVAPAIDEFRALGI
jgi:hypothetical protein